MKDSTKESQMSGAHMSRVCLTKVNVVHLPVKKKIDSNDLMSRVINGTASSRILEQKYQLWLRIYSSLTARREDQS